MKLATHKAATAAAVLALGASTFLAGAPAANASGTGTACPSARVCFYFNSDFQGARADYANSDATMGNELFTDGPVGRNGWGVQVNNNAASLINNTYAYITIYDSPGCEGYAWYIQPGDRLNLGTMKNRVSSIYVAYNGGACLDRDQSWA
ncbi:peptidase inhibitor family I36 protein [Pseudarthrobacter scleromae]|uniref:Peptidase inhibitor family I36 n=1 Tax=Pseudarthrobacter scleromae TaxID=158897 RepID=A0ABQ2CG25_9MICC|nr:peptidase inhibitor family I36 protein [Pseudarthrobacter scleromae]GGI83816.1 hypothetical protein GCM10007175_21450 [Pseudarthrobacter scleromae]